MFQSIRVVSICVGRCSKDNTCCVLKGDSLVCKHHSFVAESLILSVWGVRGSHRSHPTLGSGMMALLQQASSVSESVVSVWQAVYTSKHAA